MAIPQERYVLINSGVAGQAQAGRRELIARLMSTNQLCGFGSVYEFTSADAVGAHFGTTSQEYIFAEKYFGFVSKQITSPQKISFARWAKTALAPQITATKAPASVADFTSLENPSLTLTIGSVTDTFDSMNFSGVTDLAGVAGAIQTAIQGGPQEGAMFTGATVTAELINGTTRFVFTGGSTGAATIEAATGTLATLLGWDAASLPVLSDGAAAEEPEAAMIRVAELSNNFATFDFLCDNTGADQLTAAQKGAVAAWANAQNEKYVYLAGVTSLTTTDVLTACAGNEYFGPTLNAAPADYVQFIPMALLAATDYSQPGAAPNVMFQQASGVTPTVTTAALADYYDARKVNYYGATQSAGRQLAFYQRGYLGGTKSPDMAACFNEIWLKDAITVEFLNLLVATGRIPANSDGETMCRTVMEPVINTAKLNGTIMPTKPLTAQQKVEINRLIGRTSAADEVYSDGYSVRISVESYTDESGVAAYRINYLLVYSKGDSIRKVVGRDVLI